MQFSNECNALIIRPQPGGTFLECWRFDNCTHRRNVRESRTWGNPGDTATRVTESDRVLLSAGLLEKAIINPSPFRSLFGPYSPETAGDHFALAWVSAVHEKIHQLLPRGEEDAALTQHSNGRDLVSVEAQDHALIEQYLSGQEIGKARKPPKVELDLDAQIAGLIAGRRVDLNPGLATGGEGAPLLASA